MTIRIATFNTENLFRRPTVLGLQDVERRRRILTDFAELVSLLDLATYERDEKLRIAELIKKYRAYSTDPDDPPPIFINQTRGGANLFQTSGRPGSADFEVRILAGGRRSWSGWAELVRADLDGDAVRNTGKVVTEVNADVLLTVEVEDRLTLDRFNEQIVGGPAEGKPYPYNMLIDGNDIRGIDIGILSRFPIRSVRSHIFDPDPDESGNPLFSRDCPEFEIEIRTAPGEEPLWLLGNHLKSKFNDNPKLRENQAKRVADIYQAALTRSSRVLVAGDMNDSPGSKPVSALLATGLQDVMSHPGYKGLPGTFGECDSPRQKIDYLLLSPSLWSQVQHVGLETRGIFAEGIKSFNSVKSKTTAASDHALLYADLDL
ncbi:endonuclease/exonuclease/phosphatase family protein [Streptomyces sp. NRRL S-475]|uniref:endonuclease/exonuclease/phosphatase family protein n=1 Tax=Streptomyces sp. NRRL S-475 TaxID=1463910 RepID=UPI0004C8C2D7|nr:endonuclease/exonuclease/phosphatase family protein [Streptomyces sp. NRRL S-475]